MNLWGGSDPGVPPPRIAGQNVPAPTYYLYRRKTDGRPFFFNAELGTTTWRFPTDGEVFDPLTQLRVEAWDVSAKPGDGKPPKAADAPAAPPTPPRPARSASPPPSPILLGHPHPRLHIHPSIELDAKLNRFENFPGFRAKGTSPADLARFQTSKISKPLLASTEKSSSKAATAMFNSLLAFAQKSKPVSLDSLVELGRTLCDELWAQVVKQSNGCPPDVLREMMKLILVLSSKIPPSSALLPFIRSHIARLAQSAKEMHFAYIRLDALVSPGTKLFVQCPCEDIVCAPHACKMQFGVSIYEAMWNQQAAHPEWPFPYLLWYAERTFLEKGCRSTVGIFREVGNMQGLTAIIAAANAGDDGYLADAALNDVGSFYKRWFRDIPGGLLTEAMTAELLDLMPDDFIMFANGLDTLRRNILMHLIGFLRELKDFAEETKMNMANLAMVFGAAILDSESIPTSKLAEVSHRMSFFITALAEKWDVSAVYPFRRFGV
jgi:hypothetical protein